MGDDKIMNRAAHTQFVINCMRSSKSIRASAATMAAAVQYAMQCPATNSSLIISNANSVIWTARSQEKELIKCGGGSGFFKWHLLRQL